jgi:transposase
VKYLLTITRNKRTPSGEFNAHNHRNAQVARRHDLNANQLFTWRREFGIEPAAPKHSASILPVTIMPETVAEASAPGLIGQMVIVRAEGDQILVWSDVETAALTRVLKALSRR